MSERSVDKILAEGVQAHKLGQLTEAANCYQSILEMEPKHPDANHNMGVIALGVEKLGEAFSFFKVALEADPNKAQFWLSYINVLIKLDRMGDAKAVLDQAKSLGAQGEGFDKLEQQLSRVWEKVSTEPSQDQVQTLQALYQKGQLTEALRAIEVLVIQFPHSAVLCNMKGTVYKGLGDLDLALAAYDKAISNKPDFAQAFNNKGIVLKEQGHPARAIDAYRRAVDLQSGYAFAYLNLANCYKLLGEFEKALEAYDRVNTADARAQSLECLYALNKFEELTDRIERLAKQDPSNLRVAALSAFVSHQLDKVDIFPFCPNPLDMVHIINIKHHIQNTDEFISNLLDEMNAIEASWEPHNKTTKRGFQTADKLFENNTPNIKKLRRIISSELNVYKETFAHRNNQLIKNWPDDLRFAAWYVKLLQGGHQGSHIHPSGWVSGVLYLKTVNNPIDNEGAIKFGLHGYDYPLINQKNVPNKIYQPESGDLVLFPSSLFHETVPVMQSVERCVVAFDLLNQIKG